MGVLKREAPRQQVHKHTDPKLQVPKLQVPKLMALKRRAPKLQVPKLMVHKLRDPKLQVPKHMAPRLMVLKLVVPKRMAPKLMKSIKVAVHNLQNTKSKDTETFLNFSSSNSKRYVSWFMMSKPISETSV